MTREIGYGFPTGDPVSTGVIESPPFGDSSTAIPNTQWVNNNFSGRVAIKGTHLFGSTAQVQNVTRYAGEPGNSGGTATQSATEADVIWWPTRPVTLRDLYVNLDVAVGGAGQSCTISCRKNGANAGPTVVISSGSTTGEDTANTVTAGPGDYLSISVVNTGTTGTLTVMCSVRFVDPASGYGISLIPFNALSDVAATRGIYGIGAPGIVVNDGQAFPVAHSNCYLSEYFEQTTATGTVAATASVAAGSGTIKAAAKFATSETYGATTTDQAHRIRGLMLTASSWYQFQFAVDGASARHRGCWVLKQRTAGAENEINPIYFSAVSAAQATTTYMRGHGCTSPATEAGAQFRLTAGVLKNFILLNEGAGVGGQTWTANVRVNGSQQLSIVLSGATTVIVDSDSTVTVVAGDKVSVELVSSATTGTRSIQFACDHLAA